MKKTVFLSMLMFTVLSVAQEDYKVLIMPKKFDFLKEENQYNLNITCKLFFEKEGYTVYYSDDNFPDNIANNRCNALYLDLLENNSVFKTKLKVELKDCKNSIILFSEEGESREKNYNRAYNEAIRVALKSIQEFTKFKNPYEKIISEKSIPIEISETKLKEETILTTEIKPTQNTLLSIITKTCYNLVDENKNVKFELLKTSNPTIFIAKKGTTQGIFTLNGIDSKFESYQNNELVVEKVEVKF